MECLSSSSQRGAKGASTLPQFAGHVLSGLTWTEVGSMTMMALRITLGAGKPGSSS